MKSSKTCLIVDVHRHRLLRYKHRLSATKLVSSNRHVRAYLMLRIVKETTTVNFWVFANKINECMYNFMAKFRFYRIHTGCSLFHGSRWRLMFRDIIGNSTIDLMGIRLGTIMKMTKMGGKNVTNSGFIHKIITWSTTVSINPLISAIILSSLVDYWFLTTRVSAIIWYVIHIYTSNVEISEVKV